MIAGEDEGSEFDLLLRQGGDEGESAFAPVRSARRSGWLWVPVSCLLVGVVICAGAVVSSALAHDVRPSDASTVAASARPAEVEESDRGESGPSSSRLPISDLADSAWVASLADRTDIPIRALRAYTGASLVVADESPECGIGWNTLAGIGFVESEHGTIHGSKLGDDGVARPDIIGIPLTGEVSMAIRDTDGGALDGDTVWDRAVGPMQFIPETWGEWGADGNFDGHRDPQNIDDSALAAARYLCAAGGDLSDPSGWIAAVHAYNPSVDYNNRVADAAQYYGSLSAD